MECLSPKGTHQEKINFVLLKQLLHHQHYQSFISFTEENPAWGSQRLADLLQLGHAYVHTDLKTIEEVAPKVKMAYLTNPNLLQRRVYSYVQGLAIKLEFREYDDYLRALTPLLVDLFRLVLEETVVPDLDRYLVEVIKDTVDGNPLYRGLQWNQSLIELGGSNLIKKTWKKHYGDYFNFSHYLSSSHLIKLINDHVKDPQIIRLSNDLRQIEKYARNIIAHELIYVDDEWLMHRVKHNAKQIHQKLMDLARVAGLNEDKQWQGLADIQANIETELRTLFAEHVQ